MTRLLSARSFGRGRLLGIGLAVLLLAACGSDDGGLIGPPGGCEPDCEPPAPEIPPGVGRWGAGPPMPGPRMRHAAVVFDGDLVVAGGIVGQGEFTASVIRLRPGSDAWEPMADLPYQLAGLSLVVVADTLYAVGGDGPFFGRPEQALFAYDAVADEWMVREDIPDWRTLTEAVELDGRLWLVGGPVVRTEEHGPLIPGDTTLVYDPTAGTWSYSMVLPTERADHEAVKTDDGRVVLVGGEHGRFSNIFPDVEIYDEVAGEWTTVNDPFATHRAAAAYVQGRVHVVGGDGRRSVHRSLDLATGEWVAYPGLPTPLEWPKLLHWDGALWLIGGFQFAGPESVIHESVWRMDVDDIGLPR